MRPLRSSIIALVALAACTDTGAHLTLSAPAGPAAAESFRVVLATKDVTPVVQNQRAGARDATPRAATYFLQRTVAGADAERIDKVDGFTLRLAPDSTVAETHLIPFVVMYDADNHINGIATYPAGDAKMPSPILIALDQIDKYPLVVEATTEVDDDGAVLEPGQVRVVTCWRDDQTSYASGIVWHTLAGHELRLLFPNDGSLDATGRELDMDCDDHAVTPESSRADCDDTRSAVYQGAPDVCDGMDTNCDGAQTIATACQSANPTCGLFGESGVSLCDDSTGQASDCHPVASCSCAGGTGGCRLCQIPIAKPVVHANDDAWVDVCYPAIGTLSLQSFCGDTNRCDVEVVGMRGGWKFEISPPATNTFGFRADNIGAVLAVKAKRADDPATYELMAAPFTPVGEVDLALELADRTVYLGIQLNLGEQVDLTCATSPVMTCY